MEACGFLAGVRCIGFAHGLVVGCRWPRGTRGDVAWRTFDETVHRADSRDSHWRFVFLGLTVVSPEDGDRDV